MTVRVKVGIVAKLRADSTLTGYLAAGSASIYNGIGAQDSAAPKVTIHKQAGTPSYTLAAKAWESEIYTVKAITKGPSMGLAGTIAERIDTTLTDQAISVSGGSAFYLRRESDIEYQESTEGGVIWNHVGAMYRVWST
jgi:hypothetical protein